MKRARALFTEGYNCQKNKRSQSLFAHIFLQHLAAQRGRTLRTLSSSRQLHPPFGPSSSAFISSLATFCACPTYITRRASCLPLIIVPSISRRSFLAFLSRSTYHLSPPSHRRVVTPWKSSLESWVNEFAITIFHVDVTTYSHVDFGILAPAPGLRPRPHPHLAIAMHTFLGFS